MKFDSTYVKPQFKYNNSPVKEEIPRMTVKIDQVEVHNANKQNKSKKQDAPRGEKNQGEILKHQLSHLCHQPCHLSHQPSHPSPSHSR